MSHLAAMAIGSNLGDRRANIEAALAALGSRPGVQLVARSTLIENPAVKTGGGDPGGPYLNAAALLRTGLPARDLLRLLHQIEHSLGRDRDASPPGAARTIDIDLLILGPCVINEPELIVPHPRLHERAFVLDPLVQIAPDLLVPTLARTVGQLRAQLHGHVGAGPGAPGRTLDS